MDNRTTPSPFHLRTQVMYASQPCSSSAIRVGTAVVSKRIAQVRVHRWRDAYVQWRALNDLTYTIALGCTVFLVLVEV